MLHVSFIFSTSRSNNNSGVSANVNVQHDMRFGNALNALFCICNDHLLMLEQDRTAPETI